MFTNIIVCGGRRLLTDVSWLPVKHSEPELVSHLGSWFSGITFHLHWKGPGFDYRRVHFLFLDFELVQIFISSFHILVNRF